MSSSQTAVDKALEQTDSLVRFVGENVAKDFPADAIAAIAESKKKRPSEWTSADLQNFWTAFNKLCVAIKPVTLDTLGSTEPRPRQLFRVRYRSPREAPKTTFGIASSSACISIRRHAFG
jgi:hypothetical protein